MHHDRSAAKAGGERTSVLETTTASFVELRELLFSVVYNLLGTVSDTEDVLQETWLAWASSGREQVANARAYLLRVAVNQALSRLRRERRNRDSAWFTAIRSRQARALATSSRPLDAQASQVSCRTSSVSETVPSRL